MRFRVVEIRPKGKKDHSSIVYLSQVLLFLAIATIGGYVYLNMASQINEAQEQLKLLANFFLTVMAVGGSFAVFYMGKLLENR